jgi:hypothetical protein
LGADSVRFEIANFYWNQSSTGSADFVWWMLQRSRFRSSLLSGDEFSTAVSKRTGEVRYSPVMSSLLLFKREPAKFVTLRWWVLYGCFKENPRARANSWLLHALELAIHGLPKAPKSVLERAHCLVRNDSLRTTASNFVLRKRKHPPQSKMITAIHRLYGDKSRHSSMLISGSQTRGMDGKASRFLNI